MRDRACPLRALLQEDAVASPARPETGRARLPRRLVVSWLVPLEAQAVVPHLSWARTAGLVVLALVELRLLVAAFRIAFSGTGNAADIEKASGAPPLLAKLMLIEARFWRAVWKIIRGR